MPSSQPWQWFRETRVAGKALTTEGDRDDISQTITVTQSAEDGLRFKIEVFGLSRPTWRGIKKDDPIEIELGYADGVSETVLVGLVEKRGSPETATTGTDTKYTIEGVDEGEGRLRATRYHHVWNQPTIDRMVRRTAREADLGIERCDAPGRPFRRRRQVKEKKPGNRLLDQFASEAEERDPQGREYQWSATGGQLSFGPKETAKRQSAVVMKRATRTTPGNILSGGLESADKSKKSDGPADIDFEITLDPRIEQDGIVAVQGMGPQNGRYRVIEYEHHTSVRDGTHKTTGTMTDVSSEFKIARNTGRKGKRQGGSA